MDMSGPRISERLLSVLKARITTVNTSFDEFFTQAEPSTSHLKTICSRRRCDENRPFERITHALVPGGIAQRLATVRPRAAND